MGARSLEPGSLPPIDGLRRVKTMEGQIQTNIVFEFVFRRRLLDLPRGRGGNREGDSWSWRCKTEGDHTVSQSAPCDLRSDEPPETL
jgi:hypothetical protein